MPICHICHLDSLEYPKHKDIHVVHPKNKNYGGTLLSEDRALIRNPGRDATKTDYQKANSTNSKSLSLSKTRPKNGTAGSNIKSIAIREGKKCRACKSTKYLTVDHIIPLSKGGKNNLFNKQILCSTCNSLKSDLLPGKNGWWPDELWSILK